MNGVISWFARNSVAANLLMGFIVFAGLVTLPSIRQEVFPEFSTDRITVTVEYLGAAPNEVEESVCVRVEEAVEGLEGIKRITSNASEGAGVVTIEAEPDTDLRRLLDDVKTRVDAIDTFPAETEKPIVTELVVRYQVINIAIWGAADERTLKALGQRVRDEVSAIPGITNVDLVNTRPYEISIEVSEQALRRYGLTLDQVARAVRRTSLDLPGGSIRTAEGEILLRAKGQAYRQRDFEELVLLTRPDGTRLLLGDVATVDDGFAETDQKSRFDGMPSAMVQVFRVGEQSALEIAEKVKGYVAAARGRMPDGIELTLWQDGSAYLRGRIDLLLRNARQGFLLVFVVLALFLKFRLSVWVSIGIPLSFLGALWLMPGLDVSVNLLSLFAFILVLGIVVDDAIIVGESIYTLQGPGKDPLEAAIEGAKRVSTPVIFAVLTSVAAFSPMLSVTGQTGKVLRIISLVVIPTLCFSLVESLLILPAHLAHGHDPRRGSLIWTIFRPLDLLRMAMSGLLQTFVREVYRPTLQRAMEWRYVTAAIGVVTLAVTVGLVAGGRIKFVFFPPVEADNVAAILTMPTGTAADVTERAVRRLEAAARELQVELEREAGPNGTVFRHVLASIGDQPYRTVQSRAAGNVGQSYSGAHLGEVHVELVPSEERGLTSSAIASRWREKVGEVPDAVELVFTADIFNPGDAINVQLSGLTLDGLRAAAAELKSHLNGTSGVFDVTDSFREGKREIQLDIRPSAEILGLTLDDLARQVRQAFYGDEAQRVQRGRDDVKVMVRYPATERRSVGDLERMRIRTADGHEVPFSAVAEATFGRGYSSIRRVDRQRTVNVTAEVDNVEANANDIIEDLRANFLPALAADHPGLSYSFEGEQREQQESIQDMIRGFGLAVAAIYVLLAIPFRSYAQPLIVLSAIPFGLVGAVWGHMIMGMNLTILSTFGTVALSGVVVNDSLVLVDFINRRRATGETLASAVREAGTARFRPILLTSLTTFAGLMPLMFFERSVQARFLVPMAVSLAFGVLFSTFITLVLIPAGYAILEDAKRAGSALRRGASWLFS